MPRPDAPAPDAPAPDAPAPDAPAPDDRLRVPLEAILAASGAALAGLMLLAMDAFMTPFLFGVAAVVLLWPLRTRPPARALLVAAVGFVLLWIVYAAGPALAPFLAVYVLAYALAPLVALLDQRTPLPRWVGAALLTAVLVGLLVLAIVLLVPQIVAQVQDLATSLVAFASDLPERLEASPLVARLEDLGVIDRQELEAQVSTYVSGHLTDVAGQLPAVVQRVVSSIGTLVGLVTILAVLPVVLFYLLRDFPRINARLAQFFPLYYGRRAYLERLDEIAGSYLRGQLLICLIAGVNVSVLLSLLGVPYGLLLGVVAAVLNLIPQIGALLTNIIASVVALAFGSPVVQDLIVVQAVLLGQALLESAVLSPHIMSHQLGMHPVLVIVVLFVFGHFFGFIGFLLAVPVTAVLLALVDAFKDRVRFDVADYARPLRRPARGERRGE